jgi:hypothetical protein
VDEKQFPTLTTIAYRVAIKTSPNKLVASTLMGNLGALLMSGGRMQEALEQLDESISLGSSLGDMSLANVAGMCITSDGIRLEYIQ